MEWCGPKQIIFGDRASIGHTNGNNGMAIVSGGNVTITNHYHPIDISKLALKFSQVKEPENVDDKNINFKKEFVPRKSNSIAIQTLLKAGKSVSNKFSSNIVGTLHEAASSGNIVIVRWILGDTFCDINAENKSFYRPIHEATRGGYLDIVKVLIEYGAKVVEIGERRDVLELAALNGHLNCVEYLIKQFGCLVDHDHERSRKGARNLPVALGNPIFAAAEGGKMTIINFLINCGVNIFAKCSNGFFETNWTTLHSAVLSGRVECVKFFVENGIDINSISSFGVAPIHIAGQQGDLKIIKYLIEMGANIFIRDKSNSTVLHNAADNGDLECVKWLLEAGFDTNGNGKNNL